MKTLKTLFLSFTLSITVSYGDGDQLIELNSPYMPLMSAVEIPPIDLDKLSEIFVNGIKDAATQIGRDVSFSNSQGKQINIAGTMTLTDFNKSHSQSLFKSIAETLTSQNSAERMIKFYQDIYQTGVPSSQMVQYMSASKFLENYFLEKSKENTELSLAYGELALRASQFGNALMSLDVYRQNEYLFDREKPAPTYAGPASEGSQSFQVPPLEKDGEFTNIEISMPDVARYCEAFQRIFPFQMCAQKNPHFFDRGIVLDPGHFGNPHLVGNRSLYYVIIDGEVKMLKRNQIRGNAEKGFTYTARNSSGESIEHEVLTYSEGDDAFKMANLSSMILTTCLGYPSDKIYLSRKDLRSIGDHEIEDGNYVNLTRVDSSKAKKNPELPNSYGNATHDVAGDLPDLMLRAQVLGNATKKARQESGSSSLPIVYSLHTDGVQQDVPILKTVQNRPHPSILSVLRDQAGNYFGVDGVSNNVLRQKYNSAPFRALGRLRFPLLGENTLTKGESEACSLGQAYCFYRQSDFTAHQLNDSFYDIYTRGIELVSSPDFGGILETSDSGEISFQHFGQRYDILKPGELFPETAETLRAKSRTLTNRNMDVFHHTMEDTTFNYLFELGNPYHEESFEQFVDYSRARPLTVSHGENENKTEDTYMINDSHWIRSSIVISSIARIMNCNTLQSAEYVARLNKLLANESVDPENAATYLISPPTNRRISHGF